VCGAHGHGTECESMTESAVMVVNYSGVGWSIPDTTRSVQITWEQ